jgi:hypothetical protein
MDPYLERPSRWPDVHQGLAAALRASLNAVLPAGYVAHLGERTDIIPLDRSAYPDVSIRRPTNPRPQSTTSRTGGATLLIPDEPIILYDETLEPLEPYIEIIHTVDERRVVTAIEIVSPANKTPGDRKRELYLRKQRDLLASRTHLIEIDLLRDGEPVVAARAGALPSGAPDYLVCLHRANLGGRFEVWPLTVRDRLPKIRVPLDSNVDDVIIDLQAVFDRNYEEGGYVHEVDYSVEPTPPFRAEDAAWADGVLRACGVRIS